ncbi:MAG: hypothetical protein II096_05680, partial [Erysipelotrichaceae bacterium]|nr:hypothetical protein [Erysipelotrichaceae bacterium]
AGKPPYVAGTEGSGAEGVAYYLKEPCERRGFHGKMSLTGKHFREQLFAIQRQFTGGTFNVKRRTHVCPGEDQSR